MLKIRKSVIFLTIAAVSVTASITFAKVNEFIIEGYITYAKNGDIHMKLMNQEQFERDVEGKDPRTAFTLLLKTDSSGSKGKVSFKFDNVPQGVYVISFYQDVNGNGICDMGFMGPKEPWGMYKVRPIFKPVFKNVSFELNEDLTNLELEAK
jgi:uncharacterized protein (DUF2141 family)